MQVSKIIGTVIATVGFFLFAGTVGASDFYEECRAAADCVAGEPMSFLQVITQLIISVILLAAGAALVYEEA